MSVRVRLAPSPTGPLHVGTARTALFNFLFARQQGGKFLLRIEDTDVARSQPEYEQEILEGLTWLGLAWDEGPYRQSERLPLYAEAIERLLREGKGYEKEGAVYLRVDVSEAITVRDVIRGAVAFPAKEHEDFVIAKPAGGREGEPAPRSPEGGVGWVPLFHLAVVVDDAAMNITHVIRGEDHLSNTPKHLLLQQALGLPTPIYAHVPLLFDTERKKLSKRTLKSGETLDVRLLAYRDAGYLPEAMVNFLTLLGWNPKTTKEVFTLDELIRDFRLEGIQKGGAIFDVKKLQWLQRQHLQRASVDALVGRAAPFCHRAGIDLTDRERLARALGVWRERGGTLSSAAGEIAYLRADLALTPAEIPWRGTNPAEARDGLEFTKETLEQLPGATWNDRTALHRFLLQAVDGAGKDRGSVLWPVRYALSGRRESPGPGELAWVLGKEETLRRIRKAIELLQ